MSLLILTGVMDSLVLAWNYLTQDGTEIKCAGHEVIIQARNRRNGRLVQQASEDDYTTKFLEAELSNFNNMTGTSNMTKHYITMKDDKPINQRYGY